MTFFFVLSGFILTYNYFAIHSCPNRWILASYAAARIARIYPVHLVTFLFSIPLVVAAEKYTVKGTLANLLLLQSIWPAGPSVLSYQQRVVAHIFVVVVIVALSDALYRYSEDPVRKITHRRMFPAIRSLSGEANEH